jgi:hypothetical protein
MKRLKRQPITDIHLANYDQHIALVELTIRLWGNVEKF